MKNYLTILLLILATNITKGQDIKPTKDETVKYINSLVQSAISPNSNVTFLELTFNYFEFKTTNLSGIERTFIWKNIPWEELDTMYAYEDETGSFLDLQFNKTFPSIKFEKLSIDIGFIIWIPKNKIESARKAFLRLSEIAKQENKDPFAN